MAVSSQDLSVSARPAQAFQLRAYLLAFVTGDYARDFFRRVALQALAVIGLVEAIFLAEHFTWVFRDAARHEANLFDIFLVLICSGTGIFDLALAISVLIAAYAALVQMREKRELIVLFASGLGPYQLSALILAVALVAQIVGIMGAGVVDPLSRYAQRAILFSAELHSLKKGVTRGEFYYFPGYVAYATEHATDNVASPPSAGKDRTLFIYQQIAPHASRVVTAANARLEGPNSAGLITLSLDDFTSHTFADAHPLTTSGASVIGTARVPCVNCSDDFAGLPRVTMNVRDMYQLMMVDQLLPFNVRGSEPEEQTVFEQLGTPSHQLTMARRLQMRLLSERFARSLLSFLAPLLALAAVCLTTQRTNWFIMPAACLALMSVYLISEWLITRVVPMGVAMALIPPALLAGLVAAGALTLIFRRQDEIARPRLTRA